MRGFGHIKVGRSWLEVDNEIDDIAVIYARAPSRLFMAAICRRALMTRNVQGAILSS